MLGMGNAGDGKTCSGGELKLKEVVVPATCVTPAGWRRLSLWHSVCAVLRIDSIGIIAP